MNTIISANWAYQSSPMLTVAVAVALEGDHMFATIPDEKLKLLKSDDDGSVYYEDGGVRYQMLPIEGALEYPSVVPGGEVVYNALSPGLLFLASLNTSSFLPQILFGDDYTYVTDGLSLVAYTKSQLKGFGLHKDVIKNLGKYGADWQGAYVPEDGKFYGHNASNYFVAACDEYADQSIHGFIIEFEKVEGVPLPDEFYQKLYNILKAGQDVLVEFSNAGVDFLAESGSMRATAHIDGNFTESRISIPAYFGKCLPDVACKAQLVDQHLKLINEFFTMVIGE